MRPPRFRARNLCPKRPLSVCRLPVSFAYDGKQPVKKDQDTPPRHWNALSTGIRHLRGQDGNGLRPNNFKLSFLPERKKTFIFATIKLLSRKHRKQHHRIAPTDWRLIYFLRHKTMKLHYFRTIYSASVISTQFPTFFPCFTKTEIASLRATDFKSSHLTSILRTDSRYDKKVFRPKAIPYTGSVRDSAHDGHRFRPRLKTDNDLTGIYYFQPVKAGRCVLFNCYIVNCKASNGSVSGKSRHTHFLPAYAHQPDTLPIDSISNAQLAIFSSVSLHRGDISGRFL